MTNSEIWNAVNDELKHQKHNHWPDHVVAQSAMVSAAAGQLNQSAIMAKYQPGETKERKEIQRQILQEDAVKAAVQAIRFLQHLK